MPIFDEGNPFSEYEKFEDNIHIKWREEYYNLGIFAAFQGCGPSNVIITQDSNSGINQTNAFDKSQILFPNIIDWKDRLLSSEVGLHIATIIPSDDFYFSTILNKFEIDLIQEGNQWPERALDAMCIQGKIYKNMRIARQFGLCFTKICDEILPISSSICDFKTTILNCHVINEKFNDDITSDYILSNRIMFGKNLEIDFNKFNTIEHILSECEIQNDNHILGTKVILELVNMAKLGGSKYNKLQETPIYPFDSKKAVKNSSPTEQYILFTSPNGYEMLLEDPKWLAHCRQSTNQSNTYQGSIYGVAIIVVHEFTDYEIKIKKNIHDSTNLTNDFIQHYIYSAFCGAGAIGYYIHKQPELKIEAVKNIDYEQCFELIHHENSGMKPLKFPSKVNPNLYTENGIIHSFTYHTTQ